MTNHLDLETPKAPTYLSVTNPRYRYKERKVSVSPEWVDAYKSYAERYQISDQVFPGRSAAWNTSWRM